MDNIKIGEPIQLPSMGSWPETVHVFNDNDTWAIKAALAAQRPLLVKGEPGCGKSQLARAAAFCLNRAFVSTVVNPQSEGEDLLWHYDAVGRLGEAQAIGATGKQIVDVQDSLSHLNFLSPGVLWWAFDWGGAVAQQTRCHRSMPLPIKPDDWNKAWSPTQGSVVLIDEIDKAESDLPNSLLETLGNGAFQIPFITEPVGLSETTPWPLVIITTNNERELPKAFVRRCLVLEILLPETEDALIEFLVKRGRAHFGGACPDEVFKKAARELVRDRDAANNAGRVPPGLAEYLDLLRAIWKLAESQRDASGETDFDVKQAQLDILEKIKKFALVK